MQDNFDPKFTAAQIRMLTSIVQVGEAVYNELTNNDKKLFAHPYVRGLKSRMRTKLVQIQCQIESKTPEFPFLFNERSFAYENIIPELRTENCILHFAQSKSPDILPYSSGYKKDLSYNNKRIGKQLVFDFDNMPKAITEPLYGLVVFGGKQNLPFIVVQFPEPGFNGIAKKIIVPQIVSAETEGEEFKRKKSVLKEEYLLQMNKEDKIK